MTVCMVQVDRWWRVVALFFRKNKIEREANKIHLGCYTVVLYVLANAIRCMYINKED